jgi:hypothetical protein
VSLQLFNKAVVELDLKYFCQVLLQIQFKTIMIIQIKNCLFKTKSNYGQDQNVPTETNLKRFQNSFNKNCTLSNIIPKSFKNKTFFHYLNFQSNLTCNIFKL